MSSAGDRKNLPRSELDVLLGEHGVEGELAERLRALLSPEEPAERSSLRERASGGLPPTRDGRAIAHELAAATKKGALHIGEQVTQPARRAAREETDEDSLADGTPTAPAPIVREPLRITTGNETLVPVHLIAEGGMGEVHRARDGALGRDLAMKILHEHLAGTKRMRERFLDEAQITAQLSHPSIPPVHALGTLPDGRPYFTMKEVHGRTLADLVAEGSLSEQRRLEIFQRVCEAVSYAHARGVIHCDLKPLNVMVGAFGEVLVMDWGVARLVSPTRQSATPEPPVSTTASGTVTAWDVAGTPAYMPPEQALGEADRIGPACDVYALGVMLFEVLAGERPYQGGVPQLLFLASQGQVPPLPRREGSAVDEALDRIVATAMRPDPAARHADAGVLAEEVARWREGAMRREKALSIVAAATRSLAEVQPMRAQARSLARDARALLGQLPIDAEPEERREAWRLSDIARALDHEAELKLTEIEHELEAALVHAPGLAEPRTLLADLALERHRDAERRRAWDEAARHEVALRAHDVGAHARYLEGKGRLTLASAIPAIAELFRYEQRDRRLVLEPFSMLGPTPLVELELPIGSYAIELHTDGRPSVRVPFVIERERHTRFARPGATEPTPLVVPEASELETDERYVPSGWLTLGDPDATDAPIWVEAFVMQAFPVSSREVASFLAAPAGAPFRRAALRDGLGLLRADWPAVGLSWEGAQAYARWLSDRTGKPWRLPYEVEWERAARGADGRAFPWGDEPEATFAHLRADGRTPARPAASRSHPYDISPFGVRGMGGNVRDWCADASVSTSRADDVRAITPSASFARRVVRGGSYRLPLDAARTTARASLPAVQGFVDVGLRLVRSLR
ncbi:MAG: SUMF1/EgtB/PvdO family nonheme iron enzyme [Sandaracinaceae bacterium]|nr:SUMF1/EgtB/PvdO family nonheme iron enzyme [Sandaracinaceae bacterium]